MSAPPNVAMHVLNDGRTTENMPSLASANKRGGGSEVTSRSRPRAPYRLRPPLVGRTVANSGLQRWAASAAAFVPTGAPHDRTGPERYPFWGPDHEDEATQLLRAIDPQTPDPQNADLYDRPEDADSTAAPGSIWHTLVTRYRRANVSAIVDMSSADASGPCLISVVYTRSCLYLHESFEACALRVGPARLQRVLFERCRASAYWRQWYVGVLAAGKAEGGPVSAARTPWAEAAAFVGRPKPQQLRHGPSTAAEVCSASRPAFEATSYGATFDANAFLDSIDDNRHHRVGNRLRRWPLRDIAATGLCTTP